ncbi:Protein VAC14 homolog [Seminavis robusta]|uniref:Protein VAC14 homolog n=1 Tax=Seminavis robusta TaxID=568900 RepID=A0A9N8DKN9_9STRA|nr:Protein VAC14 homolog [Seminavis robusta]|eukprot:Sro174_g076840.1 Protein VAC14 homolog (1471) ;mRNA; f:91890-96479
MSLDEDIELHITPSADDILEVSPVNSKESYAQSYHSSTSAGASPTASMRHRRHLPNEDAFSSSSDGSDDEQDYDDTRQPPPRRITGTDPSSNSRNPNILIQQSTSSISHVASASPTSQQQQQQQQRPLHVRTNNNSKGASQTPQNTHNNQQQQQPQSKGRSSQAQSEFDKALLTGVPSRGHATSFFNESTDYTDANASSSDGIEHPYHPPQQQPSIPEDDEVSAAATHATAYSNAQSHTSSSSMKKHRKTHKVSITTTTHSSANSVASVASAASSTYNPLSSLNANNSSQASQNKFALHNTGSFDGGASLAGRSTTSSQQQQQQPQTHKNNNDDHLDSTNNNNAQDLSSGVLPDVLMTMRQKIESMQLFDSDMMKLASSDARHMDEMAAETRESLKRSSQQSISAAVLVSLAHKRYERRRLAAMEIEKVVRSLVQQNELERVRAILLLLSDDYVRSTSEDARKGGVVALAACAIGLKKANDVATVMECRDLILASVVHACQDHSQRVRYYATESLFNVVKVIPGLAVQHFFILFEILRSLYADVDVDVRSGAELLDKKLKEVIVGACNSGSFSTDACVPVFARFVYMRNKATKRLTLTWLQELNEKLIGAPILEFLHLFLGGIFDMVADPSLAIRQSALAFLQSVLPKLLVVNSEAIADMDHEGMKVDFDKILQSLVTTMEHPDPFVRKVAMYWMSRIVKAHMKELHARSQATKGNKKSSNMMNPDGRVSPADKPGKDAPSGAEQDKPDPGNGDSSDRERKSEKGKPPRFSAASISVRNSLPHVLPGILLSIGDNFNSKSGSHKDTFLPDQTTNELAEQTNAYLRDAVRRDGQAYVQHLDSFIVALREELDSPGGISARNPPAEERKLYRIDVNRDGTGIESPGWYRASNDTKERNEESMVSSRLCALHWIIVLYESVVPDALKAEYAREFIVPIIHQLVDNPPEKIVFKSLEVLAKITVPVSGEEKSRIEQQSPRFASGSVSLSGFNTHLPPWASPRDFAHDGHSEEDEAEFPMTDANASFALDILHPSRRKSKSRDREVFTALIQLHCYNQQLLNDLSRVIAFMCRLQPPEFVFVSFAVELDRFFRRLQKKHQLGAIRSEDRRDNETNNDISKRPLSSDLEFVASFVQQMSHVLLNAEEAKPLRDTLRDCVGFMPSNTNETREHRRVRLFSILLHSFSHSVVATVSLCLWGGAYRTASMFLSQIVSLDINLMFLLELDQMIESLERPLFRHLHVRMLEGSEDPFAEASGAMLFKALKFLSMIVPQSTCYNVLKDRLISISRFRQSTAMAIPASAVVQGAAESAKIASTRVNEQTEAFVARILNVRAIHCDAMWQTIRSESLETQAPTEPGPVHDEGESRRQWLGYASKEEQQKAEERYKREKLTRQEGSGLTIEQLGGYEDLGGGDRPDQDDPEADDKEEKRDNPLPLGKRGKGKQSLKLPLPKEGEEPTATTSDAQEEAWKAYWQQG